MAEWPLHVERSGRSGDYTPLTQSLLGEERRRTRSSLGPEEGQMFAFSPTTVSPLGSSFTADTRHLRRSSQHASGPPLREEGGRSPEQNYPNVPVTPFWHMGLSSSPPLPNLSAMSPESRRTTIESRRTTMASRRSTLDGTSAALQEQDQQEPPGLSATIDVDETVDERVTTEVLAAGASEGARAPQCRAKLGVGAHVMYGFINSIVAIPVMLSFSKIIFSDPFFKPYEDLLAKLVVFSAAVHSGCFAVISEMPFAVGQVQDAGLIFLSTMATAVVASMGGNDSDNGDGEKVSPEKVLATVLCTLALSTTMLGLALIITGRLKLASLVQYLPLPVIGGYLAYIGLFCGQAGLGLMAHAQIKNPMDVFKLEEKEMRLLAPGLVLGVAIYVAVVKIRHFAVLPCALVAMVTVFYGVLFATGTSLAEARELGWVPELAPSVKFWKVWDLYHPSEMDWTQTWQCIPTWIGMYFVVAFGSSLDVTAIQMDLGRPLDIDRELMVVGASNGISGLLGGYTGSYIFSQTLFIMRAGVESRLTTFLSTILELCVFLMPTSPLPYVPNFFFGAILVFIMLDLSIDWLWHARIKLSTIEYFNLWASFVLIVVFGLELGMVLGCVVCALGFVVSYSRTTTFQFVEGRARVVRSRFHAIVLRHALSSKALACLQLNGYIFFGSALQITKQVKEALKMYDDMVANRESTVTMEPYLYHPSLPTEVYSRWQQHVVVDFSRVIGLDATAARAFSDLRNEVAAKGAVVAYAGMPKAVERLLEANGAFDSPYVKTFVSVNDALVWSEAEHLAGCESSQLPVDLLDTSKPPIVTLLHFLLRNDDESGAFNEKDEDEAEVPSCDTQLLHTLETAKSKVSDYFQKQELRYGALLFEKGDPGNSVWLVAEGNVTLRLAAAPTSNQRIGDDVMMPRVQSRETVSSDRRTAAEGPDSVLFECGAGAVVGDMDFVLQQRRTFAAQISSIKATVYLLTRSSLDKMMAQEPMLASVVNNGLLRSTYLHTQQYLETYI